MSSMKSNFLILLLALCCIFLTSCGGDGSSGSSSTSSTTTTTPSQRLQAAIASQCKTNCNTTVAADNPNSRLQATIKTLKPNSNTSVAKDNPSVRLGKVVSDINFNLCKSGEIAMAGCPSCEIGGQVVGGSVQGYGTPNMTWQCQCPNGTVVNAPGNVVLNENPLCPSS